MTSGSNGIPADEPMHVVREDPKKEGLLYAGTWYGAYVSFDQGKHWQALQQNPDLPYIPVRNEQAGVHMAVGYAKTSNRLRAFVSCR